jgi:hypothetical protein
VLLGTGKVVLRPAVILSQPAVGKNKRDQAAISGEGLPTSPDAQREEVAPSPYFGNVQRGVGPAT